MLSDLEEFPLSEQQEILREAGTDHYLLAARRIRGTHQLIEWIMGRVERIEVVAPVSLRDYIMERLDAMQTRYT